MVARGGVRSGRMAERAPRAPEDAERNARLCAWLAAERWSKLAAIAYRHGIARQDVEDLIQDALVDVLRSFPGPDHHDYASAYAARCVERRALKRRRRIARKEAPLSPLPGTDVPNDSTRLAELAHPQAVDPADLCVDRDELRLARKVLLELPCEQRAAVALRAAGADTSEICRSLGVSPRRLRKLVGKAHRELDRRRGEVEA
jgi:RNA polymerase sigma factor (sigma-70 family)